jgi:hypothetical protein
MVLDYTYEILISPFVSNIVVIVSSIILLPIEN